MPSNAPRQGAVTSAAPAAYTGDQVILSRGGRQYTAPISAVLAATQNSISGFGDSITVGYQSSVPANAWLALVGSALGATVNNQGIAGTVLEDSAGSGGTPLASNGRDRFAGALLGAAKTNYVYLFYGYNDARYTAAPATINAATFAQQYREVVSGLILGGYPVSNIVIGTLWYITDQGLQSGSSGFTGQTRAGFEAFNTAITAIAQEYGLPYADVYGAAKNAGAATGQFTYSDNIHPIDSGHAIIAATMLSASPLNTKPLATGLTVSSPGAGQMTLTWAAPTPPPGTTITGYDVQYGVDGSYDFANDQTVTTSAATFTGLPENNYRMRVRVTFSDGSQGPWAFAPSSVAVPLSGTGTFVYDTFDGASGTSLTAHTGQTGATWTAHPAYSSSIMDLDGSGGVYSPYNPSVLIAAGTASDANQDITATFVKAATVTGDNVGFGFYMDAVNNTYYWVRWNEGAGQWQLYKTVAGTSTSLGSFASTFAPGASHSIKASIRASAGSVPIQGSTVTANIVVYLDSTAIMGANDTSITTPARVSLRFGGTAQTAATGVHVADITANAV